VEATAAIQNKIGQFIVNPQIRNIIGQVKSKIDMRKIMDEGKILIANISKGRIGEDNSRLLGALVITKLQLAAMSRVDIHEEERRDFYLYIDEFQNFATDAFCNILSEARKYRLALILGNQYIAQLEEMTPSGRSTKVRDAIFGNVGTIICFRVGAEDAEFLEREFIPEFLASDLVNLTKYNIYLKLMINGVAGRPFSAETMPPLPKLEKSNKEKIIKISRERNSVDRKVIEDKISKWTGVIKAAESAPSAPTQVLYDAQCALCKKWTKIVFPPTGSRPIYCKSCLKKIEKERESAKKGQSTPTISLQEATKTEPTSFTPSKKESKPAPSDNDIQKAKRKEVKVEELKKVLEKALKGPKEDTEK
jgi:CxxC-x17-CxxC domain-containing protein